MSSGKKGKSKAAAKKKVKPAEKEKATKGRGPPSNEGSLIGPGHAPATGLLSSLSAQERIERVKALWKSLPQQDRLQHLTVDFDEVLDFAKQATREMLADPVGSGLQVDGDVMVQVLPYEDILQGALERKGQTGTWKEWSWPSSGEVFSSQDDFRKFLFERVYPRSLAQYLPKDAVVPLTADCAAERMRKRLAKVWKEVNDEMRVHGEALEASAARPSGAGKAQAKTRVRQNQDEVSAKTKLHHIDLIVKMMAALSEEHELLYQLTALPVNQFLVTLLPDKARETRFQGEINFEDLSQLQPSHVQQVYEWLVEKFDGFAASWKDPGDDEDGEDSQHLADIDLFNLVDASDADSGDKALRVNTLWLEHLQERVLGDDGNPHKADAEEDPGRVGLVLEWVYGSIVSTSEKARENAKRHLHPSFPPDTGTAWQLLHVALKQQEKLADMRTEGKRHLRDMLESRSRLYELQKQFPTVCGGQESLDGGGGAAAGAAAGLPATTSDGTTPPSHPSEDDLPDRVIVELLEREKLLTSAKIHVLRFNLDQGQQEGQAMQVRRHRHQQKQGEPRFERAKKSMEEVKSAHRGLDGSYRNAADMDRHRQAMADAAIQEQLQAQSAFRAQGSFLQGLVNKMHQREGENRKLDAEIKQLQTWRRTVANVAARFEESLRCADGSEGDACAEAGASEAAASRRVRLVRLREQFFSDMRRQLYSEAEDRSFYKDIQASLKVLDEQFELGEVAVMHLEQHLLNVSCDDPGSTIGMALVLPMLQERLNAMAAEHAALEARRAEEELIRLNEEQNEKAQAGKATKARSKQKAKQRQQAAKERDRAEREAAEAESQRAAVEAAAAVAAAEAQARVDRETKLKVQRELEEAELERRRQELLNDEYWRARMEQDLRDKEMMQRALANDSESDGDSTAERPDVRARADGGRSTGRPRRALPTATDAARRSEHAASVSGRGGGGAGRGATNGRTGTRGRDPSRDVAGPRVPQPKRKAHNEAMPANGASRPRSASTEEATSSTPSGADGSARARAESQYMKIGGEPAANAAARNDGGRRRSVPDVSAAGTSVHGYSTAQRQSAAAVSREDAIGRADSRDAQLPPRLPARPSAASPAGSSTLLRAPEASETETPPFATVPAAQGASPQGPAAAGTPLSPDSGTGEPQALHSDVARCRTGQSERRGESGDAAQHRSDASTAVRASEKPAPVPSRAVPLLAPLPGPNGTVVGHALPRPAQLLADSNMPDASLARPVAGPAAPLASSVAAGVPAPRPTPATLHANGMAQVPPHAYLAPAAQAQGPHPSASFVQQAAPAAGPAVLSAPVGAAAPMNAQPGYHAADVSTQAGTSGASMYPTYTSMPAQRFYAPHSLYGAPMPAARPAPHAMQSPPAGMPVLMMQQQRGAQQYPLVPVPYQPALSAQYPGPHGPTHALSPQSSMGSSGPAPGPALARGASPVPAKAARRVLSAGAPAFIPSMTAMTRSDSAASSSTAGGRPLASTAQSVPAEPGVGGSPRPTLLAGSDVPARNGEPQGVPEGARPRGSAAEDRATAAVGAPRAAPSSSAALAGVDNRTRQNGARTEGRGSGGAAPHGPRASQPQAVLDPESGSASQRGPSHGDALRNAPGAPASMEALSNLHAARLRLVHRTGLSNRAGDHNCFLNVIVQALWHLDAFAQGLLAMDPEKLPGKESCPKAWALLLALYRLFKAFDEAQERAGAAGGAEASVLSPDALRAALPAMFKRDEMHDASEVLMEMFAALHLAEVGAAPGVRDPTLPLRFTLPTTASRQTPGTWAAKAAAGQEGVKGVYGDASLLARTFGLPVQVSVGAKGPNNVEVERYTKHFQMVTTHRLAEQQHAARSAGGTLDWSTAVNAAAQDRGADVVLLSLPRVLALMLVWDSAAASTQTISGVVAAMVACDTLDASKAFAGVAGSEVYRLRCLICYHRHHYKALVRDVHVGWLIFDDTHIELAGTWPSVLRMISSTGLQPSILFYEMEGA